MSYHVMRKLYSLAFRYSFLIMVHNPSVIGGFVYADAKLPPACRYWMRATGSERTRSTMNHIRVALSRTDPQSLLPKHRKTGTHASHNGSVTDADVNVANGATVTIDAPTAQSVTFSGTTGTLKLADPGGFTGVIAGLAGADAIDLSGFAYGENVAATYLGTASGGTLTVTDGAKTARIALSGNYLSSTWTLSSDGEGGTTVVDPTANSNWQPIVAGGGYVRGLDVAPDGTMVGRTDTNGAYLWSGTQWVQLVTSSSMPAAFDFPTSDKGVYELQIADSNTNILYMAYNGYVFKSTNKGTTWTQTSFTPVSESSNDSYGQVGQKMAVDPNNPNIVYVGTEANGMFVTTNGGQTWSSVSAIPVSQTDSSGNYFGDSGILFDPALGGTTNGVTQTIFAASYGHGVYESTNGGSSWTLLTGSPTEVDYAAVSSTGVYYTASNGILYSYASGKWTDLLDASADGIQAVAVNPTNPDEIVVSTASGHINVSYNGGSSWSGFSNATSLTSADVPWLAQANSGTGSNAGTYWMSIGGMAFNPAVPNQLIASGGTGVWNMSLPASGVTSSTNLTWADMSTGVENLVANEIIVPTSGHPVLASWDRPFIYVSNVNTSPSTYGPVNSDAMNEGWSVDYASSNANFVVGIADWYGGVEQSGYSTNGGQTWTTFASLTPSAGGLIGGTIAASTPENIIWAPSGGNEPYYTTNGGASWTGITLPGVTSWSGFDWAYYLDQRSVTADRVLANTFYLYYPGEGVFETSNGGSSWKEVFSGQIGPNDGYNSSLQSVPGEAGNLFYTAGPNGTPTATPANQPFYRSTDGGATWTVVPNVLDVFAFGYGAAAPGQSYPAIYIAGYVNSVYGVWQSTNNAQSWTNIGSFPAGELDTVSAISGDPNTFGQVYVGFAGGGYAYLSASAGPQVSSVATSPATGVEVPGNLVKLTLTMSAAVTVAGGTPTLSLNDGGTATYTSGSGTNTLTFSYTVAATDENVSALAITGVNLPTGVTIADASGNAANLSLDSLAQAGPQIDAGGPAVTSISTSPATGDLSAGSIVTLTLAFGEAVTVAGGTPTLTLNDGGTATYASGSGTSSLTFSYTVATGQNTPDLMVTTVNLNAASIKDSFGNVASLSLTSVAQSSPKIDTIAPAAPVISGDTVSGNIVTLNGTAEANSTITVFDNSSQLGTATTNSSGAWTFATGALATGSQSFTAKATDGAGNVSPTSSALGVNVTAPLVTNGSFETGSLTGWTEGGNSATVSAGPQIFIDNNPESGTYAVGLGSVGADGTLSQTVATTAGQTYTLSFWLQNEASGTNDFKAIWNGQTLLSLANAAQSGYKQYSYAVTATGSTSTLEFSAANGPSQWDLDNISLTANGTSPAVTITGIANSPASGQLNATKTVALTLAFSGAVTVAGGTPTLTLNDGGTATYASGSGTSSLTFSYTVATGQNAASLAATAVNLSSGVTIKNSSGNAVNLSLAGLTQTGPTIDTIAPAAPVISGDTVSGNIVTLKGTAEANSTITVFDNSTQLGTATTNSSGAWTFATGTLASRQPELHRQGDRRGWQCEPRLVRFGRDPAWDRGCGIRG